jgi:hypothetical protein
MARRRILASISGLLASLPLALAPAGTTASNGQTQPVSSFRAVALGGTSTPSPKHTGRATVLPARPSDPAALKAAKARANGHASAFLQHSFATGAPCSSVTQTMSPASPQAPGTAVTFTASAAGCPSPTYEFWLQPPGGSWSVVQAYSATASWTWSTGGLAAGTYTEDVYARDASSSASYDTYLAPAPTYVLQTATCASVTESASPPSPQSPGTSVTFTAVATGCPHPNYEFWLQPPGSSWSVVQPYSATASWTWNTGGLAAGTYVLDVYARDATSTASYDAHISPNPTYALQAPASTACTSVTESATPASPQAAGTVVTFTAAAVGCPSPNYEFWLQPPGGSWSIVQAYSSASTFSWSTTGLAAGTYQLDVYARNAGSSASYEAHISPNPTYTLQASVTTCTSDSESASPASPQGPGTTVTFTAGATGCPNPNFEFWLQPPNGSWSIAQAYSSSATWTWNTSGLATGTYVLDAYARDASSTASYDAHLSPNPTYVLQVLVTTCTSVSESASPASPQTPGTSVTFTASASGCPRPNYEFWLQPPGGSWAIVQAYSTSATWTWNTTGLATGTYTLDVYARDASSTAAYDAHLSPNPTFLLGAGPACTAVSDVASAAPPQQPGTTVTFTATATGCPSPTFEFWLQAPGGPWTITQAYSASASWTWNTTGLGPGTYLLDVYARQNGSTASFEAHISPNPSFRLATGWNGINAPGVSAADESFCCVPPDTTGSIGPANYVEIINNEVAVYDRNLNLIASSDLGSFSNAGSLNVSDPQMQWDPRSGRWLYSLVGFNSNFTTTEVLFGWSKTADPTDLASGWCRFAAPSGSMLPDYDKLGHDDNFIIVGANLYDMSQSSQPFVSAQIFAMIKPKAGDTSCAAPLVYTFADSKHTLKNTDGTRAFTPIPANTVDASQGGFVVAAHSPTLAPLGPQTKIMSWHLSRQGSGAPALNADGDMTVNSFDVPGGVPQPGGGPLIDSLDARLTQAVAHADPNAGGAEAVWTQHAINGPGGRSVVRWYELLPATQTVRQQGQVASATDYVFNGAISPSITGSDAVVVYDRGGSSESPVVAGQGHSSGAAAGVLDSGETVLATSTGVDTDFSCSSPYGPPCRWGDYGGASPDPLNPGVVWGTEEWSGPSSFGFPGWGTENFALAS